MNFPVSLILLLPDLGTIISSAEISDKTVRSVTNLAIWMNYGISYNEFQFEKVQFILEHYEPRDELPICLHVKQKRFC